MLEIGATHFKNAIFKEKSNIFGVYQSALQKEMCITFYTDCSMTSLGPLRMMEQGITRIMGKNPAQNVLNES